MALTLEQLVAQLTEAGLATAEEITAVSESLPPDKRPRDAEQLGKELVRQGKLTKYQAMNVFRGKAKGLFFGEYLVLDKLGAGGMGAVFRAQHRRMKRIVALKLLPPSAMQGDGVKRFYREVQTAALLTHPNIVTAYDAGEANGMHYLIMEYVEGQDLSAFVKKQGPLKVEQAANFILQAARGLEYAHQQNVVHRDIKPGNLLLDRQGRVKILDMGLALVSDPMAAADVAAAAGMTQAGLIMGTADYMAPEQAQDTHSADGRSDIYSLGCTLYRLLTGEVPYKGETMIQKILAHRDKPVPSVRKVRPEVPAQLDAICMRMLAKLPADRYQAMTEVIADLERCNTLVAKEDAQLVTDFEPATGGSMVSSLSNSGTSSSGSRIEGLERSLSGVTQSNSRSSRSTSSKAKPPAAKPPWLWIGAGVGGVAVIGLVALVFTLSGGKTSQPDVQAPLANATVVKPPEQSPAADPMPAPNPAGDAPAIAAASSKSPPVDAASKPAATASKAPEAAAKSPIMSAFSLGKTVNLAPLLDLVGDRVEGQWHARAAKLLSPETDYARMRIPAAPPADYRLTLVARRIAGKDALGLGLVVGGTPTVLCIDAGGSGTALAWYDGKPGPSTASYRKQVIFADNQPRKIECTVHPAHVSATADEKTIFEWRGDRKLLGTTTQYGIPDRQCLFLATRNSVFEFSKLELLPIEAEAASSALAKTSPVAPPVKPAPSASSSPASAPPSSATPKVAAAVQTTTPATPKPAQPLTGPVDLLKLVDLKRGAVGTWTIESGALVRTGTGDSRVPIPFIPPENYDLTVTVEGPVSQTDNSFVLVVQGHKVGFQYTPRLPTPTVIFDCRQPPNLAYRPVPIADGNATKANFLCAVRGSRVYITVDEQPVLDWTGDPKTLEVMAWHDVPVPVCFVAAARGKEPGLRFTKFEISPPTTSVPEVGRVDWLALIDPQRDRSSGEPRRESGDLLLPQTIEPKGSNVSFIVARPSEYVVTAVVERLTGRNELGAGMMLGDHRGAVQVDSLGQSVLSPVASVNRDWQLTPWRQHTLVYTFTAQSAQLNIDGREVLKYPQTAFNIKSLTEVDVSDPRAFTIHANYLSGFQISSWELAPIGWKKHARPTESQLTDATKSLQPSLAPTRAKDAKAEQKALVAESLWRQAATSLNDDARHCALLESAASLAAQAGNFALVCHAATDLARSFDGSYSDWFATLASDTIKSARATADRQKLVLDALRQIERAVALEEYDLAVALQIAALSAAKPPNSDAAKELKARGGELRFYQAERTAYLAAQAAVDAGRSDAAAQRTIGRYLGLVRGDWSAAARALELAEDPVLLAIAKGELSTADDADQQFAQADRWWALFEKGEAPLKYLAMERAVVWYRRAASKATGKAKTMDQRRRVITQQRKPSNLAFMQRHPVDAVKLGEHWYKRYPGLVSWKMAARFCDEMGGNLLVIESAAENEAIAQMILAAGGKQEKGTCWLGCSDEAAEGQWSWVNGTPLDGSSFLGWPSGQPDNAGGDSDYGVLDVLMENGQPTVKWDDRKAVDLWPFICEWEI